MDWAFAYPPEPNPAVEDVIHTTGAILAGRRWYEVATSRYGGRAGIYGGAWTGPVFVLTHRSDHDVSDPRITLLSGGVTEAVATTLAAADSKNIGIFGANIAQQCLAAGLVDEIFIHLAPVLLGDGIRLYGGPGAGRVNLEPISVAQSGQLTDLRFRILTLALAGSGSSGRATAARLVGSIDRVVPPGGPDPNRARASGRSLTRRSYRGRAGYPDRIVWPGGIIVSEEASCSPYDCLLDVGCG